MIIAIIDPYDCFGLSPFKGDSIKFEIAQISDHNRRNEFISFYNSPKRNIILGDSQLQHLETQTIPGGNWAQLSTPGSGIEDEVYLLEKISSDFDIDTLLLGINPYEFVHQTSSIPLHVTKSAIELAENNLYYFFDRYVFSSTIDFVLSKLIDSYRVKEDLPDVSKEEFWQIQLGKGKSHLEKKTNRIIREKQLESIKSICNQKNIKVLVVIPISHIELYDMYDSYLEGELLPLLSKYFDDIYDFYYPNSFTEKKDNFNDPFHAIDDNDIYVNAIFHGDTTYCRKIGPVLN